MLLAIYVFSLLDRISGEVLTMKAIRVLKSGGPEVLQYEENVQVPKPNKSEVRFSSLMFMYVCMCVCVFV